MEAPEMFGAFFPPRTARTPVDYEGDTWAAWKTLQAALFALPMDDATLIRYRHHTGRETAPVHPFKRAAIITGRRGGKSRNLATLGVFLATVPDYSDGLHPAKPLPSPSSPAIGGRPAAFSGMSAPC